MFDIPYLSRNDGTAYFMQRSPKNINEHFSHLRTNISAHNSPPFGRRQTSFPTLATRPASSFHPWNEASFNSLSGPPDPAMIASVSTYAGQRWSRSERGRAGQATRLSEAGHPQRVRLQHFGRVQNRLQQTSMWKKWPRVPEGGGGAAYFVETTSLREEKITHANPSEPNDPELGDTYAIPTRHSWYNTQQPNTQTPIEAAALSVRQSMDGYAFRTLEQPPPVRLAADYI
ncbi:hypothetical protein RhiLY_06484 [Ceratobasidium sp. AG-Ba]|nr:hypothetical protein RhiLY_06484 [Ceratobasidium sp. AG-Ba]